MTQEKTNSRRSFLSAVAILSSGAMLAGSPLALFEKNIQSEALLKNKWAALIKKYNAAKFLNITGTAMVHNMQPVNGHVYANGEIIQFTGQNLLAQPTWIYWVGNKRQPADVVIHLFEDTHPYKRIKSINRFELLALAQLPAQQDILHIICTKVKEKQSQGLEVKTHIAKRKTVQDVSFIANNNIVSKQQFFYNV